MLLVNDVLFGLVNNTCLPVVVARHANDCSLEQINTEFSLFNTVLFLRFWFLKGKPASKLFKCSFITAPCTPLQHVENLKLDRPAVPSYSLNNSNQSLQFKVNCSIVDCNLVSNKSTSLYYKYIQRYSCLNTVNGS